jgi:hypothetical protein
VRAAGDHDADAGPLGDLVVTAAVEEHRSLPVDLDLVLDVLAHE